MVKADHLWRGLGTEPIDPLEPIDPMQHLSLYGGQVKYNPSSMNVFRLVDSKKQLFLRTPPIKK
jgi:hypothetical protein